MINYKSFLRYVKLHEILGSDLSNELYDFLIHVKYNMNCEVNVLDNGSSHYVYKYNEVVIAECIPKGQNQIYQAYSYDVSKSFFKLLKKHYKEEYGENVPIYTGKFDLFVFRYVTKYLKKNYKI